MRVLMLLTDLTAANGVTSFAMSYYRTLDHDAVRMDFAVYHGGQSPYEDEIKKNKGNVFVLPPLSRIGKHVTCCKRLLAQGEYQVIHNNVQIISIPMMMVAKEQGVSVRILHAHSTRMSEYKGRAMRNKAFYPLLLSTSNSLFACGHKAGSSMFGNRPYTVVPNTISPHNVMILPEVRDCVRRKEGVGERVVVATIGRATPPKNPLFALDVIQHLKATGIALEYWWIGGGPMHEDMKRHVKSQHMDSYVKLMGPRFDVGDLYQAIDVFFLPSVFEGLPLTGIEAQAYGLPSVVSDAVTKEFVYTDLVEFVSLHAPLDEWSNAIKKQARRISQRRSYRQELLNSQFSSVGAGDRLTNAYEELLERLA